MAGEEKLKAQPLTYEEARAKYMDEADREYDGKPPYGGERERRFHEALSGVQTVFDVLAIQVKVHELSGGKSGILSDEQVVAIGKWHGTNRGVISLSRAVNEVMEEGTAFGFVEGQVADLEAVAAEGLALFERPEQPELPDPSQ